MNAPIWDSIKLLNADYVLIVFCREVLGAVFVERVVGAEAGERLSRRVRQPQQDVPQSNLPERDASRLEQLQPTGPVELWLSAR